MDREPEQVVRVAICDDHPVFRAGIVALISDEPDLRLAFQVGTVAEVRARLREAPDATDLLLLDFDLPDGHGLDVVSEASRRCRVLVLSAFDDADSIRTALERGAVGFVRKDSPPTALLRALRDAARGQTVLKADVAVKVAGMLRAGTPERDLAERIAELTDRQREVLTLLGEGRSNREIARALFVTEGTVKNHVTQILQIVGVPDRTRLAVLLARHGRTGSGK
jgi:DNA-binding NarL/FixJ family response regulator